MRRYEKNDNSYSRHDSPVAYCLYFFKVGVESEGVARKILDFVMTHGILYIIAVISMFVLVDGIKHEIPYRWLWFLGVLVLLPVALPIYLIARREIY